MRGRGKLQRQNLLSTKGREGPRRTATATSGTATATPFVHEGPRRGAENCNCNFFCPRRAAKGREELQRQLQERQRQHLLSTEDTEGHGERRLQLLLSTKGHEGPRRTTKNCNGNFRNGNCNTFCPRRTQRGAENCNCNFFCPRRATKGREGPRRTATATSGTATATPFVHEGPRRGAENCNCNFFCPRRATKGREGPRRTATATSGTATATSERQRQHLLSTKDR